jgi:hypothetical protein
MSLTKNTALSGNPSGIFDCRFIRHFRTNCP